MRHVGYYFKIILPVSHDFCAALFLHAQLLFPAESVYRALVPRRTFMHSQNMFPHTAAGSTTSACPDTAKLEPESNPACAMDTGVIVGVISD